MEFINAYKRLDNLCKDLLNSETGITTYLEALNALPYNSAWKSDYHTLRHYRHLRNKIVHENNADEASLCKAEDILWLEEFHKRILERRDPLAQHQLALEMKQRKSNTKSIKNNTQETSMLEELENRNFSSKKNTVIIFLIFFLVIFLFLLLWLALFLV